MKRRNFLKFLGLATIAPKVAVDVLSKIPVSESITMANGATITYGGGKAVGSDIIAKQLKRVYGQLIIELFEKQTMAYDMFAKMEDKKGGILPVKKGYYFNLSEHGSRYREEIERDMHVS
jgi:hypothetical protein